VLASAAAGHRRRRRGLFPSPVSRTRLAHRRNSSSRHTSAFNPRPSLVEDDTGRSSCHTTELSTHQNSPNQALRKDILSADNHSPIYTSTTANRNRYIKVIQKRKFNRQNQGTYYFELHRYKNLHGCLQKF
jgi:hypothetical protein